MKALLLICSFAIIVYSWYWDAKLVSLRILSSSGIESVLTLPNKDKKRLNFFFHELLLRDGGIYTLLGDKPISFGGYFRPFASFKLINLYHAFMPDNLKMYWAWQTYLKYQHLFDNSKYTISLEQSPWIDDANIILFMNKDKAASIIKRYEQDFCEVMKKEAINVDELIREVKNKPLFSEVLYKHEGLIGTLLGYGRDNAWLFLRRSLGENIVLASPWDTAAEIELLNKLYGWHGFFSKEREDISEEVFCPSFAADLESEETKQLTENYLLTKQKIIDTYKGKKFLETTLGLLM